MEVCLRWSFCLGMTSFTPTADRAARRQVADTWRHLPNRVLEKGEQMRTTYPAARITEYRDAVQDVFGKRWLASTIVRSSIQGWWQATDPMSIIALCRLGRDICMLRSRGVADQEQNLRDMAERIKRSPHETLNLLYELHIAMMFHPEQGLHADLAPKNEQGYDVRVTLPDGRRIWISCKRLNDTEQHQAFQSYCDRLSCEMRTHAADARQTAIAGLVVCTTPLVDVPMGEILTMWDDLCMRRRGLPGWVYQTHDHLPLHMSLGPHPLLTVPGTDARRITAAHELLVVAGLPPQEFAKFESVYKKALRGLRTFAPAPSKRDIWMVALEVPAYLSLNILHARVEKECAAGHYQDMSAMLLTTTHPAIYMPSECYTAADQFALLVNSSAHVPLGSFLDEHGFGLLAEGRFLTEEPVPHQRLPGGVYTIGHGYKYVSKNVTFLGVAANQGFDYSHFPDVMFDDPAPLDDTETRVDLPGR